MQKAGGIILIVVALYTGGAAVSYMFGSLFINVGKTVSKELIKDKEFQKSIKGAKLTNSDKKQLKQFGKKVGKLGSSFAIFARVLVLLFIMELIAGVLLLQGKAESYVVFVAFLIVLTNIYGVFVLEMGFAFVSLIDAAAVVFAILGAKESLENKKKQAQIPTTEALPS